MSMKPIDPIVIKEKLERQAMLERRQHATKRALTALGWFGEYAVNTGAQLGDMPVKPDTLASGAGFGGPKAPQLIVASSTPGVEAAAYFITQAYMEHRRLILERAIALAQEELAGNELDPSQ